MHSFTQWAEKWGIPHEAVTEYLNSVGAIATATDAETPEALVAQQTRLEASRAGVVLTRNNVGGGKLENGRYMRWGLWNESPQMNANFKSPDLIGLRPVLIGVEHIGATIGQFVARETKRANWKFNPNDKHSQAQLNAINFINARGGDAKFTTRGFE